jgi:hypothetical protein
MVEWPFRIKGRMAFDVASLVHHYETRVRTLFQTRPDNTSIKKRQCVFSRHFSRSLSLSLDFSLVFHGKTLIHEDSTVQSQI